MKHISVIGAGSWGTAISNLLAEKGFKVHLWARQAEVAEIINTNRRNPYYLTDLQLSSSLVATSSLQEAVEGSDLIVLVVPSHAMKSIVSELAKVTRGAPPMVSLTKGLDPDSLKTMSKVLIEFFPDARLRVAALSGPNHAEEVSQKIPSATVVGSVSDRTAKLIQDIFMTPYFRVYTNSDLIGIEIGAAIKNVIAIAAGISDGLGYGDNTKASLMTRGLAEMTRLGIVLGANPLTFAGLSGVGDLIVTCTSRYSRNRAAGMKLAEGKTIDQISKQTKMVAEGIRTAKSIYQLAQRHRVEMPISRAVYQVIYENKDPHDCVRELMSRGATSELEEISRQ